MMLEPLGVLLGVSDDEEECGPFCVVGKMIGKVQYYSDTKGPKVSRNENRVIQAIRDGQFPEGLAPRACDISKRLNLDSGTISRTLMRLRNKGMLSVGYVFDAWRFTIVIDEEVHVFKQQIRGTFPS